MPLSNKGRQAAYKKRMNEAGYKQMQVWVPIKSESKTVKMERKIFIKRVESLTVGWTKARLNRLFKDVIKYISVKIKKEEGQQN